MADLVRAGEMDFPAGRVVFAVDQSRASFAAVSGIQEMVSPGKPSWPHSGSHTGNHGADGLGRGYRGEFAAL